MTTEPQIDIKKDIVVKCYDQAGIAEAVRKRLAGLGYTIRGQESGNQTFNISTGQVNGTRATSGWILTVDEFFKLKDDFLLPVWIEVRRLQQGDKYSDYFGGETAVWTVTNYVTGPERDHMILAVNDTFDTQLRPRDDRVKRVVE